MKKNILKKMKDEPRVKPLEKELTPDQIKKVQELLDELDRI